VLGKVGEFDLTEYLTRAEQAILPSQIHNTSPAPVDDEPLYVGADLGTAYLVLVVLDKNLQPVAGEYQFAQVVKDGLVVDFFGAVDRLKEMKQRLEARVGRTLTDAASSFPPGVPQAEVRATANVVEAAGLNCVGLVDEPTAANNLLGIQNGAIVDVGGGTTGIALVENGKVIFSTDEATGGTHFSLVIAGARNISFEEAEELKKNAAMQKMLFPVVRPVMEKVGNIITRQLDGRKITSITLVGGAACFPGMAEVVQDYTGIATHSPEKPLFVTPIGIAMHHAQMAARNGDLSGR
jgi:ethanolamine utilization protein EutJ